MALVTPARIATRPSNPRGCSLRNLRTAPSLRSLKGRSDSILSYVMRKLYTNFQQVNKKNAKTLIPLIIYLLTHPLNVGYSIPMSEYNINSPKQSTDCNYVQVNNFLHGLGWGWGWCQGDRKLFWNPSEDCGCAISMETGAWMLFGEAFSVVEEGYSSELLEEAMVKQGMISPACPYCGERGGELQTAYSREYQGCAEHGGMVTFVETQCSKCIGKGELK